jgi:hypothetical protein
MENERRIKIKAKRVDDKALLVLATFLLLSRLVPWSILRLVLTSVDWVDG